MIARKLVATGAAQAVVLALGVVAGVLISRLLGPSGRGAYAIVTADAQLLALLCSFGLGTALPFFTSSGRVPLSRLLTLVLLTCCTGLFLMVLVVGVLPSLLPVDFLFPAGYQQWPLQVALFLMYCLAIAGVVLTGFLNGWARFSETNRGAIVRSSIILAGAFLLLWRLGPQPGSEHALHAVFSVVILAGFVQVLFLARACLRRLPRPSAVNASMSADARLVFGFALLAYASDGLNFLNYRLDLWFLEAFRTTREVGLYSLAVSALEVLWLFGITLRIVLLPHINAPERLQSGAARHAVRFYARLAFFLTAAAAAVLALTADFLLPAVYGAAFAGSVAPLKVLLVSAPFSALTKVLSVYSLARNEVRLNVHAVAVGTVVTIVGNILLVPSLGVIGASITTAIVYATICLVVWVGLYRRTDFQERQLFVPTRADVAWIVGRLRR